MIRLSERLRTVAAQVETRGVAADIGCDHGFTSIYLVQEGLAARVIAMDIGAGPLQRAKEHIRRYGLEQWIETRQSDGLEKLCVGEADTLLISGMGGALMCRILSAHPEVTASAKELVLSPQSEWFLVRRFLLAHGFRIDRERMLCEQGKYYLVLRAVPGKQIFSCGEEYLYGRDLLERGDACLFAYLQQEERRLECVLDRMQSTALSAQAQRQKAQRQEALDSVRRAMQKIRRKQRQDMEADG